MVKSRLHGGGLLGACQESGSEFKFVELSCEKSIESSKDAFHAVLVSSASDLIDL